MIKNFEDLKNIPLKSKVILLYSGGLDSTFLYIYLKYKLNLEVVLLKINVGQREEAINIDFMIDQRDQVYEENCEDIFCHEYILKALHNSGKYLGGHPLSASLSRPLFAKVAMDYAKREAAKYIIHSATSHQNSLRRFNGSLLDLGFSGEYGSPFHEDEISREDKVKYLKEFGICVSKEREFSFDTNIFARECEGGEPVDDEIQYPKEFFSKKNEEVKTRIEIEFIDGRPVALNGNKVDFKNMIYELNSVGEKHGIGQYMTYEENQNLDKMFEIKDSPAFEILNQLYQLYLNKSFTHELVLQKLSLDLIWAREASEGRWYGLLKKSIEAFNQEIALNVNGIVKVELKNHKIVPLNVYQTSICKSELGEAA